MSFPLTLFLLLLLPLFLLLAGCVQKPVVPADGQAASQRGTQHFIARVETRSPEELARFDFTDKQLAEFHDRLEQALATALGTETEARTVQIQVTLSPKDAATVDLAADPKLPQGLEHRLRVAVEHSQPPRAKLVPFCLRFLVKVGAGSQSGESAIAPKLLSPHEKRLAELARVPLKDRLQIIQTWVRTEALPLWTVLLGTASADYKGLPKLARRLVASDPQKVSAEVLLDHDPSYFQALLEMAPGDPLVAATHVLWPAARGELDLAWQYFKPVYFFSKSDNLSHHYLVQLRDYLRVFFDLLEQQLAVATGLHDQGEFAKAIELYDNILSAYPCSSLALYEKWYSSFEQAKRTDEAQGAPHIERLMVEWRQTRKQVFACLPMFRIDAVAHGQEEQKQMFRRLAQKELWTRKGEEKEDFLSLAQIALDLGEYAFAAHIYFLSGVAVTEQEFAERKILAHFLFALERLGVTEIKTIFKGDPAQEFGPIQKQIENRLNRALNQQK
ncbi:MAG TPA: hypothetical protein PKE31_16970 [Pseudomonadota bacterium]|nr:hypothetical protein [Pseudomonadota bacterium]